MSTREGLVCYILDLDIKVYAADYNHYSLYTLTSRQHKTTLALTLTVTTSSEMVIIQGLIDKCRNNCMNGS